MQALKLQKLLNTLKDKNGKTTYNYTIPDLWNCFDYNGSELIKTPTNELMVDPYNFYSFLIEHVFLTNTRTSFDPTISLARATDARVKRGSLGGDWIKESVVYSTMIRASAAWDNDRSGALEDENIYRFKETGSFVKMMALLPLLKKMGVDVVYMLPISKYSLKDKKGELGSPYGVSNFNAIDENLKDALVGDALTVEEEFQAFVEACHLLNMRVMIDIIPRTNAVENDLIKDNPDWFYWIKASESHLYRVPRVPGIKDTATPDIEHMPAVYSSDDVKRHISMFQLDPKSQDKALWDTIKHNDNIAEAIETHFDLKIAPAFSDHINDIQPPWTDVTFFRMYLDHPKETAHLLDDNTTPPYILFDTIKSNKYHGSKPNNALWDKLSDIIPHYQNTYGIDGARIDMGHALPGELVQMIFEKARAIDPNFAFIAEELEPKNAEDARNKGYNIIIGNGFIMEPRIWTGNAHEFFYESRHLKAPVFACGETHDTPRLAARDGNETLAKTLTILNMFMPNAVPFINSAQEVFERQPMNTGVDCKEEELYRLEAHDPYYKKLALFDRYQYHYTNPRRWELPDILDYIKPIRARFLKAITNTEKFVPLYDDNKLFIGFSFILKQGKSTKVLVVLGNLNPYHEARMHLDITALKDASGVSKVEGDLLFSTHEAPRLFTQFINDHTLDIHLGAGEVKIVEW